MPKQLPRPGEYLQPNNWAYWMPDAMASGGMILSPLGISQSGQGRRDPLHLDTTEIPAKRGILGEFGPSQYVSQHPTSPQLSAGSNGAPAWRMPTGANFQGPELPTAMGPVGSAPIGLGMLASPIEHVDSSKYWGAASFAPRPSGEQFVMSPQVSDPNAFTPREIDYELRPSSERPGPLSRAMPTDNFDDEGWRSDDEGTRNDSRVLSDAAPDNYWVPGADYAAVGHHWFPRANFKLMQPETRKVFDQATTGKLFIRSINGRRHEHDHPHR
jgi:hypothetical protein